MLDLKRIDILRCMATQDMTEPAQPAVSAFRWIILAFVVTATTINYLDRQIIALLKPVLETEFGWTASDYGHVVSAFQFAAAISYLGAGWFIDRMGLRWGYAIAVGTWSLVAMAHAAGRSLLDFVFARVVLGVTESGNTPAAVKAVAEWFPTRERALALGFMNAGANMGAIVAPLTVPALALAFGWKMTFVITGGLGLLWVVLWLAVRPRPPPHIAQRGEIAAQPATARVKWSTLLRDRRTWVVAGAKFLTDPVWWFLLFWLPDFMHRVYGLDLRTFGVPLATIYALATVGALGGGWLPSRLLARGRTLNAARKITLLVCALAILPLPFVLQLKNYWQAVAVVGIALAAHQGFSTNVFALATDLFPREVVGSVIGIGALFGNIAGLLMLEFTGWMLDRSGSYLPMFGYCACAYVMALLLIHVLVPKLRSAVLD